LPQIFALFFTFQRTSTKKSRWKSLSYFQNTIFSLQLQEGVISLSIVEKFFHCVKLSQPEIE